MDEKIKVKLLVDLTKYAEGLVKGSEGYTVGSNGMWSRANDNFITVCFPGIATLDVLWKSLEIIDEEYLKKLEENNNKFERELKTAKNVKLYVGPKGGFHSLSFDYTDERGIKCSYGTGFKSDAERIMEIFNKNNISIQKIKE